MTMPGCFGKLQSLFKKMKVCVYEQIYIFSRSQLAGVRDRERREVGELCEGLMHCWFCISMGFVDSSSCCILSEYSHKNESLDDRTMVFFKGGLMCYNVQQKSSAGT